MVCATWSLFSAKVMNLQVFGGGEESTYSHLAPKQNPTGLSPKIIEKHANFLLTALNPLPEFIF